MKKLIRTLAVVASFAFAAGNLNAQSNSNDQAFIGKAQGAAHDCLQPYEGSFEITSGVETTGICFVSGSTHRVTFAAGPKCTGNGPCPMFATRIIATVDFDCDGNVAAVNCAQ